MTGLDSKDEQLLEFLHRSDGADVQQLCDLLEVTRNAIRSRITRLEALQLVEVQQISEGRGRPRNVYRLTADGVSSLGEDYRQLAIVMWEAICQIPDEAVREGLLSDIRNRLASRFRPSIQGSGNLAERLDQLVGQMRKTGFNVESDSTTSLPILRESNCPFPMLADVDDRICEMERQVVEEVLGAPVEFKHRCRDGHHCCEFEIQSTETEAATTSD
ncbi:MAG: transcriptional regulator [Fuerstiella sp.]